MALNKHTRLSTDMSKPLPTPGLRDLLALKKGVQVALIPPEVEGKLDQPFDRTGQQFVFCVLKVPEKWMLYI